MTGRDSNPFRLELAKGVWIGAGEDVKYRNETSKTDARLTTPP
jgi:hypothetical protein